SRPGSRGRGQTWFLVFSWPRPTPAPDAPDPDPRGCPGRPRPGPVGSARGLRRRGRPAAGGPAPDARTGGCLWQRHSPLLAGASLRGTETAVPPPSDPEPQAPPSGLLRRGLARVGYRPPRPGPLVTLDPWTPTPEESPAATMPLPRTSGRIVPMRQNRRNGKPHSADYIGVEVSERSTPSRTRPLPSDPHAPPSRAPRPCPRTPP